MTDRNRDLVLLLDSLEPGKRKSAVRALDYVERIVF